MVGCGLWRWYIDRLGGVEVVYLQAGVCGGGILTDRGVWRWFIDRQGGVWRWYIDRQGGV